MKTGKTGLPRSINRADEFFILQEKRKQIRIEGDGYVIREFDYSDCDSLAENANNNKIWNNLMDYFPRPYARQDAFANFHYEKLYTIVFSTNPRSMYVSLKAGYQQEAVLHHTAIKNGQLVDFYYFCKMCPGNLH